MPWNLIILPLLGGFIFLDWCYYSRLRHQRIEGNRLLLESAFLSVFLAGSAAAFVALCRHTAFGSGVAQLWFDVFPQSDDRFKYSGTAALAFLLGLGLAGAINLSIDLRKRLLTVSAYAAEQAGDYALSMVFQSVQQKRFLTILTANRMAYTGYVSVSPILKIESQIVLTIAAEGYMEKDSSRLTWTSEYTEWLSDGQKAKDYMIAIPTRSIENLHFFHPNLDRLEEAESDEPIS